jgi:NADH:ubiquinone oxidoreductase subunit 4 (subunit M)
MNWPPAILSILVWAPALGAVLCFLGSGTHRKRIGTVTAALSLALAAGLALTFEPEASPQELRRWIPPLGLTYDLQLDGFGSLLILWISLLALLAMLSSGARERHIESLILVSETALLGLATASDGALFLSFYGAGLLSTALLLGRTEAVKPFLVFQSAGAALAVVSIGVSYHLARIQTGFPSAEIARFSSLVTFPDFQTRMFLVGAAVVAFAAPLFPFTTWVKAQDLTTEGRLLLLGGWSLAGTLFFTRSILPAYAGGGGAWLATALAALSVLYAGIGSRFSWAALLVGFQGLIVLGLLSPTADGVAAGRAAMLQLAMVLSALALWTADTDERGPAFTSAIAIAMVLPPSWLVLLERWSDAPVLTALSGLGLVLMMFHLARMLPRLSWRRSWLLLPLLALWTLTLLAPSRFLPGGSSKPAALEEE